MGEVRLARGTSRWLAPMVSAAAVTIGVATARRSWPWTAAATSMTALSGLMLWFFRDPDRTPGAGSILSPADGVVQAIEPWPDGRTRVSIFMSPFDVHVNRAPADGVITSVQHVSGGYLPAFEKDSDRNERVIWRLDTKHGDIELVQIAGAVARRIVPYVPEGTRVGRGERIGLIRLGSRVDVYLPENMIPAVRLRERTRAGQTALNHEDTRCADSGNAPS
ncbi:phosphatidylserine decarboxylase [Phytoactinopolyspora limicola]|uniref:phosphatidylserine decarboxylase n=1 Tax=Phytoactinopolyspora limicola TaxID=2715536 RepID=UPI00140A667A|nr:phosphatidylserine decarboxylase [Phytoactinopolyspora limicola]